MQPRLPKPSLARCALVRHLLFQVASSFCENVEAVAKNLKQSEMGAPMRQGLSTVLLAAAFVASSGFALAAGPNDAFNYPNAEAHKQYSAYRNQDHNNPSPRYAVTTTTNSEHPAYRN